MKKLILLLVLLIPALSFAQMKIYYVPFIVGNDTIFTTTSDTIDVRIGISGLAYGPWEAVTKVLAFNDTTHITSDDKAGQLTKTYYLADETWWTWAQKLQVRIRAEDDTLTGKMVNIGDAEGSITLFVQPTIFGDATPDTILYKVRVGGR